MDKDAGVSWAGVIFQHTARLEPARAARRDKETTDHGGGPETGTSGRQIKVQARIVSPSPMGFIE